MINLKENITNIILPNLKRYLFFIFAMIGYLLYFFIFHHDEPNCIIKRTIGFPCPGCGMSRALYYLVTLQLDKAFLFHPLVFIIPFIAILLLEKGTRIADKLLFSKLFWTVIITLYIGTYIIRMFLYFPNTVPMDYYDHAILKILR